MAIREKKPRRGARLKLIAGSRICRRVGLVVFVTLIVVDVSLLVPSYLKSRTDFERDMRETTLTYVNSAINTRAFPRIETLVGYGEHLVGATEVAGGIFVNSIGDEVGSFGERPWLTWRAAALDRHPWVLEDGGAYFDVYLRPAETSLSYGLILRVDTSEQWNALTNRYLRQMLFTLFAAALITAIILGVVFSMVISPVRRISSAIDSALHAPEKATQTLARLKTSDELGQLGRAVDQLLFLMANTYVEDLATAFAINEQVPGAILTFSEDGHLVSANAAALRLFKVDGFDELLLRESLGFISVQGEPRPASELIGRGRFFGPAEAIIGDERLPCLAGGDAILRGNGTMSRYFLMLIDVNMLVNDMRWERQRRITAEDEQRQMGRNNAELVEKLNACLTLMQMQEIGDDPSESPTVTVRPETITAEWLRLAIANGSVSRSGVRHGNLPPVLGTQSEIEMIFKTALGIVRGRSHQHRPVLEISGTVEKNIATFLIREVDEDDILSQAVKLNPDADVKLQETALSRLVTRQKGTIVVASDPAGLNEISFQLMADLTLIRRMRIDFSPSKAPKPEILKEAI